eukprot:2364606-Pleurochrysis_carterae.AAC.1
MALAPHGSTKTILLSASPTSNDSFFLPSALFFSLFSASFLCSLFSASFLFPLPWEAQIQCFVLAYRLLVVLAAAAVISADAIVQIPAPSHADSNVTFRSAGSMNLEGRSSGTAVAS